MIIPVTEEKRRKMTKDGSTLKWMRSTGGMAKGCLAGGICLLFFALLTVVLLLSVPAISLFFGVIFGIPGLLMLLLGAVFHKKKTNAYLSYYQKESGYEEEEIKRIDQELLASDLICIGNIPVGTNQKKPQIKCYITMHNIVIPMPLGKCYVRKIEDMVAAIYCETIPGIGGYKRGLVFISKQDDDLYCNADLTRESCAEVIRTLHDRNPQIIINQFFVRDGIQFDLLKDWRMLNNS